MHILITTYIHCNTRIYVHMYIWVCATNMHTFLFMSAVVESNTNAELENQILHATWNIFAASNKPQTPVVVRGKYGTSK